MGADSQTKPIKSHVHQSTHELNKDSLFSRSPAIATSDFGSVTVWKAIPRRAAYRDLILSDLSRDLADALRESQPKDKLPLQDFKTYVLLTRFGQSYDDIRRLYRVAASPRELLLKFRRHRLPVEESLAEELLGHSGAHDLLQQADRWLDELMRDRQGRQVTRARTALRAYAMWHKQGSLTIAEIARVLNHPGQPQYAFELIKRALLNMMWLPKSHAKTRQLFERFEPKRVEVLLAKLRSGPSPTLGAWGQGSGLVDLPMTLEREEYEARSETGTPGTVPDQKIAAPPVQAPSHDLPTLRPRKTLKELKVSLKEARRQIRKNSSTLEELGPDTTVARASPAATSLRRQRLIMVLNGHEKRAAELAKKITGASKHSVASSPPANFADMSKSEETDASEGSDKDWLDSVVDDLNSTAANIERPENLKSVALKQTRPASEELLPTVAGQASMTPRQKREAQQNLDSSVQRLPRSEAAERRSRVSIATKKQRESAQTIRHIYVPEPTPQSQAKIDGSAGKYNKDGGVLHLDLDAS